MHAYVGNQGHTFSFIIISMAVVYQHGIKLALVLFDKYDFAAHSHAQHTSSSPMIAVATLKELLAGPGHFVMPFIVLVISSYL